MNDTVSPSNSDLLAYYQFNQGVACGDNLGITMLTDSTSNGLDGTLTNFSMSGDCISNFSSNVPSIGVIIENGILNLTHDGGILLKGQDGNCYLVYINVNGGLVHEIRPCP